ncbi:MAG: ATP-binding protein [Patescibacteria group bacterium]|nr:ATP-binding protein [Patescibacteria group bacterium]
MKIVGVTGGKGGTGKSTAATALAYFLAKQYRVLLVDADVDCPNDHLLLGASRKKYQAVEQRIPQWDRAKCRQCGLCGSVCKTGAIAAPKNKKPVFIPEQCNGCGACVLICPAKAISWSKKNIGVIYEAQKHKIDILSGEIKINEPVSEFIVNALNQIISRKQEKYDYILIDTAAGIHCPVAAALGICDFVLAVTEPTPLGRHDLELILQLLQKIKKPAEIVLNQSDIGDKRLIVGLADKYDKKITAEIPYSRKIATQYSKGEPISDKNINKLAEKIVKL